MPLTLLAAAAMFIGSERVRAESIAVDVLTADLQVATGDHVDRGYQFVPTKDIIVTQLLVWDYLGNDFQTFNADVAIWDVANPGSPLVSGSITAAGAPIEPTQLPGTSLWRSIDVPDTQLTAGTVYRIAGDGFGGSADYYPAKVTMALDSILYQGTYRGQFGVQLSEPAPTPGVDYPYIVDNSPATYPIAPVSFMFVPEPSSGLLMALAFGALAFGGRSAFGKNRPQASVAATT
jgi:hypothetical protein